LTWVTTPALKSVISTLPCAVRDPCAALYIGAYRRIRCRVAAVAHDHTATLRCLCHPDDHLGAAG
jgi:hypothetical protein